jgi:hypothetical protein
MCRNGIAAFFQGCYGMMLSGVVFCAWVQQRHTLLPVLRISDAAKLKYWSWHNQKDMFPFPVSVD